MGADQIRPEILINVYAKTRKGARNIASALGFLALLWSTVVLLGGFVSVLTRKDFWFLSILSLLMVSKIMTLLESTTGGIYMAERSIVRVMRALEIKNNGFKIPIMSTIIVAKHIVFLCLAIPWVFFPHMCFLTSVTRLVQRDYGDAGGDTANKAKLDAALDIFYVLVLIQISFLWYWMWLGAYEVCILVSERCGFENWGPRLISRYRQATQVKCNKDDHLPMDWNLVTYGVVLLESACQCDRLSGARVLDTFIQQGKAVRKELLSSRQSIQNLIAMTNSTSTAHSSEIRERAARIVAYLAGDILTDQFPEALRCVCSLLESHRQYVEADLLDKKSSNNVALETSEQSSHQEGVHLALVITEQTDHQRVELPRSGWYVRQRHAFKKWLNGQQYSGPKYSYTFVSKGTKELISQGLLIVERLTQDQDNCRAICDNPRLLSKITSPIMSYQDYHSNAIDQTWVAMLIRSLTVLIRLIISPGEGASRLRHGISGNLLAVRNLMGILESGSEGVPELREQALQILTELAFDDCFRKQTFDESSTNTSIMEKFIQILEGILFEDEDGSAVVANQDRVKHKRLTRKAGEALARLLAIPNAAGTTDALNSAGNGFGNVVRLRLREDMSNMLGKVLRKVLCFKTEAAPDAVDENVASNGSAAETSAENQPAPQYADSIQHSTQEIEEQYEERKLTVAMISLAVVICTKYVVTEGDFARATAEDAALVKKLKEIIEIYQDTNPDCLRIVKLSCQVVITISHLKPSCIKDFNEHCFEEVLSEALKTFSDLDSCMFFAGDDRELIKPVMSLPSLVKEAQRALQRST